MNETYVSDAERLGQLRRGKGINNTSNGRAGEQKSNKQVKLHVLERIWLYREGFESLVGS